MTIAKAETRLEIRRTAKRLFKEKGYAGTSMRDLAREVGIEAASLYNHLSSKEELLKEICFEMAAQFFDAFQQAVQEDTAPSTRLKSAINAHVEVIWKNLEASAVFFHEWVYLGETDLSQFVRLRRSYEQGFRKLVQEGMECGELKKLDERLAVFTILSALNATYDLYRSSKKPSCPEIAESIAGILLEGLKQ